MEQLIELLQQIQDLAGVGIEALQGASADAGGEGAPPEGGPESGTAAASGAPAA
jgi:hypothetical protein